jgi:hypothetical protein
MTLDPCAFHESGTATPSIAMPGKRSSFVLM